MDEIDGNAADKSQVLRGTVASGFALKEFICKKISATRAGIFMQLGKYKNNGTLTSKTPGRFVERHFSAS